MSAITTLSLVNPDYVTKQKALSTEIELLPFEQYQRVIVFFSGGKDSLFCVLDLLERGIPKEKIELHHHLVDGDTKNHFMDWPVTRDYCRKIAEALGVTYRESWRDGGFKGELLKENSVSLPIRFIDADGIQSYSPVMAKPNTRRKWPAIGADLRTRWCSPSLKIEVGAKYLTKSSELQSLKVLCVTGERAEESSNRAKYLEAEIHRTNVTNVYKNGKRVAVKRSGVRFVDHYRPALYVTERQVWDKMKAWGIVPHPVYYIGFSRCSCAKCIFINDDSLATLYEIDPDGLREIARMESDFNHTIHRSHGVLERAGKGTSHRYNADTVKQLMSDEYTKPIFTEEWSLPSGAFGKSDGPV